MIAALFVQDGGTYFDLPGIDPWPEQRDARKYSGPNSVIAHPPCARWCRLAKFVESQYGYKVGDDGGCFESALNNVLKFGGILEHPAESLAWKKYGLLRPPSMGWAKSIEGYWVAEVAQSAYGHPARKLTWLLYRGSAAPPALKWERPQGNAVVSFCSYNNGQYKRARDLGLRRLSKKEASATPIKFRDTLVGIVEGAASKTI